MLKKFGHPPLLKNSWLRSWSREQQISYNGCVKFEFNIIYHYDNMRKTILHVYG